MPTARITLHSLLYVYRTKNKVKGIKPHEVADQSITKERWLVRPTKFVLVQKIPRSESLDDLLGDIFYLGESYGVASQRRTLPKIRRFLRKKENVIII